MATRESHDGKENLVKTLVALGERAGAEFAEKATKARAMTTGSGIDSDLLFGAFLNNSFENQSRLVNCGIGAVERLPTLESIYRSIGLITRHNPIEGGKLAIFADELYKSDSILANQLGSDYEIVRDWFFNRLRDADEVVHNVDSFFSELKSRAWLVESLPLTIMLDAWSEDIKITPGEALMAARDMVLCFSQFPGGFPGAYSEIYTTKHSRIDKSSVGRNEVADKVQHLGEVLGRKFELDPEHPLQKAGVLFNPLDIYHFFMHLKSYFKEASRALASEERFYAQPAGDKSFTVALGEGGWSILCRAMAHSRRNGAAPQARIALVPPSSPIDPEGKSLRLRLDYDKFGVTYDFGQGDFDAVYNVGTQGFRLAEEARIGGLLRRQEYSSCFRDAFDRHFSDPVGIMNCSYATDVGGSRRLSIMFAVFTELGFATKIRNGNGIGHHVRGEANQLGFNAKEFASCVNASVKGLTTRKPRNS